MEERVAQAQHGRFDALLCLDRLEAVKLLGENNSTEMAAAAEEEEEEEYERTKAGESVGMIQMGVTSRAVTRFT